MASLDRKEAVTRARKFWRLTKSPNKHEAARAQERLQAFMKKHGLTEADILAPENVVEIVERNRQPLREELARMVGVACGCVAATNRDDEKLIAFRGPRDAVQQAQRAYGYFVTLGDASSEMPKDGPEAVLANWADNGDGIWRHRSQLVEPPQIAKDAWRLCWWIGYLAGLGTRLQIHQGGAPLVSATNKAAAAAQPNTPTAAHNAASEALGALEGYAQVLDGDAIDVMLELERLRHRADDAGRRCAARASLADIPKSPNSRVQLTLGA